MSIAIVAFFIVTGFLCVAALAVGIPVVFGFMAHDILESRKNTPFVAKDTTLRIAAERGTARAFVLVGGVFWAIASFAGLYSFRQTGMGSALIASLIPLAAVMATLIVGWYFERVTAAMLMLASFAVVAWGTIFQFEMGVWLLMTLALIGPMMTASVLFWLARRDQEAYERETLVRPQLALVFAARSTIG
jgi:hypothetical protein